VKIKTHLRVGYDKKRRKTSVVANVNPNHTPLSNMKGEYLPTVAFAIVLDIPDSAFAQAEQVIAEITIPESEIQIAAEVVQT
jgi:hypothetical protein